MVISISSSSSSVGFVDDVDDDILGVVTWMRGGDGGGDGGDDDGDNEAGGVVNALFLPVDACASPCALSGGEAPIPEVDFGGAGSGLASPLA